MNSRLIQFLSVAFLLVLSTNLFPTPPELVSHPRLLVTEKGGTGVPSVKELKARITNPDFAGTWQSLQESSAAEDLALYYLLSGNAQALEKVKKTLAETPRHYRPLCLQSLAYDWVYDGLSDQERKKFAANLIDGAQVLFKRYALKNVYHNMVRGRIMAQSLAMLAAWDDDPRAKELYPGLKQELEDFYEVTGDGAPLDDMEGRGLYMGGWPESFDYDRHGSYYAMINLLGWRSAGLKDYFTSSNYWRDKIGRFVYSTFPDGKYILPHEDNDHPLIYRQDREEMTWLAAEYNSGIARQWLDQFAEDIPIRPFWAFIFDVSDIKPVPLNTLHTSTLLQGSGTAMMRSSWNEDASYVHFLCTPFYAYHQQMAQGSFSIYREVPRIVEPGVYDNTVNDHYVNWRVRSISHNCLLVLDPEEKFLGPREIPEPANDGGQKIMKWILKPSTRSQWLERKDQMTTGQITSFLTDTSHDLVTGEAAGAYAATKVRRWCRQMLYIKPDWVVVADFVVSTKSEYTKTLVFHSLQELTLDGNVANSSYEGKPCLAITSLLPEGGDKRIAGGRGMTFQYGGNDWMGGDNPEPENVWDMDSGFPEQFKAAWRLEVEAPPSDTSFFLTTIYLPDFDNPSPSGTAKVIENTTTNVTVELENGKYTLSFNPRNTEPYTLTGQGLSYSIAGTVADSEGFAVEGVKIKLSGQSAGSVKTDRHGAYLFTGLTAGDYSVSIDGAVGKKVTLDNRNVSGVDFEK